MVSLQVPRWHELRVLYLPQVSRYLGQVIYSHYKVPPPAVPTAKLVQSGAVHTSHCHSPPKSHPHQPWNLGSCRQPLSLFQLTYPPIPHNFSCNTNHPLEGSLKQRLLAQATVSKVNGLRQSLAAVSRPLRGKSSPHTAIAEH